MRLCVALGVALGLDLLAKGTAITVAPIIAAAVVLGTGWRDWRGLLMRGLVIDPGRPSLSPWYLFLYRTYGDFSGLARVGELQYWNGPMGTFSNSWSTQNSSSTGSETWGEFGWRQIHLRPELLWAIAIPTILALAGLAVYAFSVWRRLPSSRGDLVMRRSHGKERADRPLHDLRRRLSRGGRVRDFVRVVPGAILLSCDQCWRSVGDAWTADASPAQARPAGQGIVFGALVLLNIVIITGYVLPFTATVDEPTVTWTWGG